MQTIDRATALDTLERALGRAKLQRDPAAKNQYGKDRTTEYCPQPCAIAFPHTTDDVVSIMNFANQTQTPLVPSGGRTGYSGDGNLHLNIVKSEGVAHQQFLTMCHAISNEVYTIVSKYHGTISAEHGIGLTKKPFLHHMKSVSEIDYMRKIKAVFDPNNILNPGKLL